MENLDELSATPYIGAVTVLTALRDAVADLLEEHVCNADEQGASALCEVLDLITQSMEDIH